MATAIGQDFKEDIDSLEYPVEIFSIPSSKHHYTTSSNIWSDISGCRKTIAVGESSVMCEITGVATGHCGAVKVSPFDFGINVEGVVHDNKTGRGMGITHTDSWINMSCHWVQEFQANQSYAVQLQNRSRDNKSNCGIWSPYLIIKLYKKINMTLNLPLRNVNAGRNVELSSSWRIIENLNADKGEYDINKDYRLSVGVGDAFIYPFKVTKQFLYFQDAVQVNSNGDDNDTFDEKLVIGQIKRDNNRRILSNDKGYGQYVHVNKIECR